MVKYKGTVQSLPPIHYIDSEYIKGTKCTNKDTLYVDIGVYTKKKVEKLGIKTGDSILLHRKIKKSIDPNVFSGAYLDNGVGCYIVSKLAKEISLINKNPRTEL